jgi:AcrR family transcriptional regulator
VAREVFEAEGFEAASMAQIAAKVGGSKGTLYGYFGSKEELFVEVMLGMAQEQKKHLEVFVCDAKDIKATLTGFGRVYMSFVAKPWYMDMYRTIVSMKNGAAMRRQFYEKGPGKGVAKIAGFMQAGIDSGQLKKGDTRVMAMQFKSLLEAEVLLRRLLDVMEAPDEAAAEGYIARAVDGFLAIYGAK